MTTPIKQLILDMDGVLWHGETPMSGLVDFFATLRREEIPFMLATNNATKTAAQYTAKLARFDIDVPPEQILTSAEATAAYLAERHPPGTSAYIVGDKGLHEAMAAQGFESVPSAAVRQGAMADLVVAGFTPYAVYEDLAMGAHLVEKGVPFIGTNPDPSYPSEIGPLPGAGALLAVIETSTGVAPLIVGKPQPIMFSEAVRRMGGAPETTAMVGDRLTTDIAGGRNAGLQTVLVLSGISTREEAESGPIQPDYIFDDITELARFLTHGQA